MSAVFGALLVTFVVAAVFSHQSSPEAPTATTTKLAASVPCPGRPTPTANTVPTDIIPELAWEWALQLPCQDMTCSEDYNEIFHACDKKMKPGCVSPGTATVKAPLIDGYSLIPRVYDKSFCSAGFYASTDEDGVPVVAINDPTSGVTTSGSVNPRVELRQMDGSDGAVVGGWALTAAVEDTAATPAVLKTTQRIMHLPPVGQSVTFAQVFNGGHVNAGPFIEVMTRVCEYSWQVLPDGTKCTKGGLYAMVWFEGKAGGKGGITLAPYTIGDKFDFQITAPGDGTIVFQFQSEGQDKYEWTADCKEGTSCKAADSDGVYFKTGAYVQNAAAEPRDSYVLTYLYSATHTGSDY